MKINNVIFDLGAVLLEWKPEDILSEAFKNKEDRLKARNGILNHPDWIDLDRGTLKEKDAVQKFSERTGLSEPSIKNFFDIVRKSLTAKEDTLEIFNQCRKKNLKLYCLSNMSIENFEYVQNRYAFFNDFSGIVVSGYINLVKPDPRIFEFILSKYQIVPSQTVFIDDNTTNVLTAEGFGIHAIEFDNAALCGEILSEILGS